MPDDEAVKETETPGAQGEPSNAPFESTSPENATSKSPHQVRDSAAPTAAGTSDSNSSECSSTSTGPTSSSPKGNDALQEEDENLWLLREA